ncbi:MAG: DUF998 domain-containing protein [Myxococcales bacterium]|nr:DUF998 domain-containing protein [Myxococcales bacterium]
MPAIASRTVDTRALLACGVIAGVFYAAADLIGGLHWRGYSFRTTTISELNAIGSPSRAIVAPLFFVYILGSIAFGFGVWATARTRALRVTGGILIALGLVNVLGPVFPIHLRGVEPTFTDAMHVALTSVTVALILASITAGAIALRGWFRVYSVITLAVLFVCGALSAMQGGAMAEGDETPWIGLLERINVHGAMLWNAVLAVTLQRQLREP